jgi:RimJ/RimL family protein N-acetyltransferase
VNNQVKLDGEFVTLRPLRVDDAALTLSWRQHARARLLNAGATTVEQQTAWIAGRPASEYNFIIELKDGRAIGMLSLVNVNPVNRHAETGRFLIGDEAATKGVPAAVEAMKLLYEFAFDALGLMRLFGSVASGNPRMAKWQTYLGMKEEGRMRNHYFIDDRWQDAIIFGLLADECRAQSFPRMNALIGAARRHQA